MNAATLTHDDEYVMSCPCGHTGRPSPYVYPGGESLMLFCGGCGIMWEAVGNPPTTLTLHGQGVCPNDGGAIWHDLVMLPTTDGSTVRECSTCGFHAEYPSSGEGAHSG